MIEEIKKLPFVVEVNAEYDEVICDRRLLAEFVIKRYKRSLLPDKVAEIIDIFVDEISYQFDNSIINHEEFETYISNDIRQILFICRWNVGARESYGFYDELDDDLLDLEYEYTQINLWEYFFKINIQTCYPDE